MVSVLREVFGSIPFQSAVLPGSHIQTGEMYLRGTWGTSTSQRDGKKKCLPVQWLHVLYFIAIIHTDWQGQALPLHLSMDCQCSRSQVHFTDPTSMRQCYSRCRVKACETPQHLLPPHFFQGALNSSNSRNGFRRKHLPVYLCLSLVASFVPAAVCTVKKRESGNPSWALLLITLLQSDPIIPDLKGPGVMPLFITGIINMRNNSSWHRD